MPSQARSLPQTTATMYMPTLKPLQASPLLLLPPAGVQRGLVSSSAGIAASNSVATINSFEEQICELQSAAKQVGPGGRALQLQAHACNLSKDPSLLAARAAVQAEERAAHIQRAIKAEQINRCAEKEEADRARWQVEAEAQEILTSAEARVSTLRSEVVAQSQYLKDLLGEVDQEVRDMNDIGGPLLAGALATTYAETEQLKGNEEHFVKFVQDSELIMGELAKRTSDLQSQYTQIHEAANEQECRLAKDQEENTLLRYRLARVQAIEEEMLAGSAQDLAFLSTEELACQQRYTRSCTTANGLQERAAQLRAEKERLHSMLAHSKSRFHKMFSDVFADLDVDAG